MDCRQLLLNSVLRPSFDIEGVVGEVNARSFVWILVCASRCSRHGISCLWFQVELDRSWLHRLWVWLRLRNYLLLDLATLSPSWMFLHMGNLLTVVRGCSILLLRRYRPSWSLAGLLYFYWFLKHLLDTFHLGEVIKLCVLSIIAAARNPSHLLALLCKVVVRVLLHHEIGRCLFLQIYDLGEWVIHLVSCILGSRGL